MKRKPPVRNRLADQLKKDLIEMRTAHAREVLEMREALERELQTQRGRIRELEKKHSELYSQLAISKGSETSLRLKLTKAREELDKLHNLPRDELKRVQIFQEVGQALEILGLVRARLNGEDGPRPAPQPWVG